VRAAPTSISVIVPVHNGARFVSEALRSVKAQTLPADEIIVVDDGSSDGSVDIVRREHPDVALVAQPLRRGPAAARNAGARRARCEALGFLDHDDLWPPERNAALLQAWRAQPEADVVCGSVRLLLEPGAGDDPRLKRADGAHVPFLIGGLLIRRSCWLAHGGMHSVRDHAEDLDLHLRLREAGAKLLSVDAVALTYRIHGANQSRAVDRSSGALLSALRAAVERRRRA
jgi:glycosyltransferase involved in cell wall biosynthesis